MGRVESNIGGFKLEVQNIGFRKEMIYAIFIVDAKKPCSSE